MRVLHTADWHLGRSFHGESLLTPKRPRSTTWLALARDAAGRRVLVAGDLYDRALPPVDAVRLADEALARLSERSRPSSSSPATTTRRRGCGFGSGLLARAGVHLRTDPCGASAAPSSSAASCVYPIPYLEPDLVRDALGGEERGHAAVHGGGDGPRAR